METVGGDGSETGSVTKKKKTTTGTGASVTPDFRGKEESNNRILVINVECQGSTTKLLFKINRCGGLPFFINC